jgi:hypothetical protein
LLDSKFVLAAPVKQQLQRVAYVCHFLSADLVADNTANRSAANRTGRASAGENSTGNSAESGTDRGILIALRHSGTTTQAKQQRCGYSTYCEFLYNFHAITSIKIELSKRLYGSAFL